MKVLFVCTGNTCRSPMAEVIFNSICPERMSAFSRGTRAWGYEGVSPEAVSAISKIGLSLEGFHYTKLTKADVDEADIVLCMAIYHKNLVNRNPGVEDKVHLIYEFAEGLENELSDPYGGGEEDYEVCATELKRLIVLIVERLIKDSAM